jgi:hypothetical protein
MRFPIEPTKDTFAGMRTSKSHFSSNLLMVSSLNSFEGPIIVNHKQNTGNKQTCSSHDCGDFGRHREHMFLGCVDVDDSAEKSCQ